MNNILNSIEAKGLEQIPVDNIQDATDKPMRVILVDQDVDSLITALDFLGTVGEAVTKSLADDGKISFMEYLNFLPVAMEIPKFVNALPKIGAQLSDEITPEEKEEILAELSKCADFTGSKDALIEGASVLIDLKNYIFKHVINKNNGG